MPDKVLISGDDNPLVQDRKYEMRCDVLNVAPVKNLFLHWYKGNTLINTSVFNEPTVHPVNTSAAITLLADGDDHGRSIWCEAVMYFYWQGTDRPASRSQDYKMEVLCMFLMPSDLPNSVLSCLFLLVLWYSNHSSSLLSSSNLPQWHRGGAGAARWKSTASQLHSFRKPGPGVQLALPRPHPTDIYEWNYK